MSDHTSRFAFVAACTVAPLAVIGSAFSLYRIAEGAGLALPLALPVALDLTALCAAAQIRARRHLALAWVTLVAGVLGSAALQVADAWARGPIAWGVHGALPLAALVCFEFTVPTKDVGGAGNPVATGFPADPSPSLTSDGLTEPEPASPRPDMPPPPAPAEVPPVPLRKAPARKTPVRPAASLEQLAKRAERVAAKRGVDVTDLPQRQLMAELRIGSARARELAEHLRQPVPLELVASTNGSES